MGIEILPTAEGALEPVRARRRSRGANPATGPSISPILRLRPREILELGGVEDGRYFGVGIIGDVVPTVPVLERSTSSKSS